MSRKISSIAVVALLMTLARSDRGQTNPPHFWAGLTVNHALYSEGSMGEMVIDFALFNDGQEPASINACIDRSTLVINDVQLSENKFERFSFYLSNGPRSVGPLAAGKGTHISKSGFEEFFQKPGLYKVVWKSNCFESASVSFRGRAERTINEFRSNRDPAKVLGSTVARPTQTLGGLSGFSNPKLRRETIVTSKPTRPGFQSVVPFLSIQHAPKLVE